MCECKELIDKSKCDDGCIWNPSIFEFECDKSRDIGENLVYENCKYTKRITIKLILDEILDPKDTILIADKKVACKNNCLIYIMLLKIVWLILLAIVSISCYCYYTKYWIK